jgi:hypothetical protein
LAASESLVQALTRLPIDITQCQNLYFSSGYEPSTAKTPALKQLRYPLLLSALLQLPFTAVAAATTRQQPQFSQPHCLLSLSEATHTLKILLLRGKRQAIHSNRTLERDHLYCHRSEPDSLRTAIRHSAHNGQENTREQLPRQQPTINDQQTSSNTSLISALSTTASPVLRSTLHQRSARCSPLPCRSRPNSSRPFSQLRLPSTKPPASSWSTSAATARTRP